RLKYPDKMLAPDKPLKMPGKEPLILKVTDTLSLKCLLLPHGEFLMEKPFYVIPRWQDEYPRHITLTPLSFQTESGDRFEFEVEPYRDVLPYDFEVASGVVLPRGPDDFTSFRFSFNTAAHRPAVVETSYKFGEFYSGRLEEATAGLSVKVGGTLNLSFNADLIRGRLPQGNFNENVFQVKADFFLSPDLGFMNYIQYDDISRELGWSARLRWQISPGNEIFLVYNKNWERRTDPASRFSPLEDRGVLKISLSIRP
ncbi:MAG: hypothetical protein MUP19_04200, partial [Candidatus Aminicenantes bacterium]|nr:hypothetical protein [Candidatus Aminicenantes bacterium]